MYHHRPMRLVVFARILKLETLWKIEVILHCAELPQASNSVLNFDVNLRPVKGTFAFHALVSHAALIESFGEHVLRLRPILFPAQVELARVTSLDGKLEFHLIETEGLENLHDEIN